MNKSTNIRREFQYKGFDGLTWEAVLTSDHKLTVKKLGEEREYSLEPITKIEHNLEYLFLTREDNSFYQFKFEEDNFLVGDIFDEEGEHLDSFASHVFGEGGEDE